MRFSILIFITLLGKYTCNTWFSSWFRNCFNPVNQVRMPASTKEATENIFSFKAAANTLGNDKDPDTASESGSSLDGSTDPGGLLSERKSYPRGDECFIFEPVPPLVIYYDVKKKEILDELMNNEASNRKLKEWSNIKEYADPTFGPPTADVVFHLKTRVNPSETANIAYVRPYKSGELDPSFGEEQVPVMLKLIAECAGKNKLGRIFFFGTRLGTPGIRREAQKFNEKFEIIFVEESNSNDVTKDVNLNRDLFVQFGYDGIPGTIFYGVVPIYFSHMKEFSYRGEAIE